MDNREVSQRALEYFESVFAADPAALHALCCNRIPCNQSLADHPHALVDATPVEGEKPLAVIGLLGFFNGFLASIGAPAVAMKWTDDRSPLLIGWQIYNPQEPTETKASE